MSSYEAGDLSALINSGSSVSQKRKNKKAEKLKKLFSTPLPTQKNNFDDSVSKNTKDPVKTIEFDTTFSPIVGSKKKRKKKHNMIAEEETKEVSVKPKKKHAKTVDFISPNAGILEDENSPQKKASVSEKNLDSKETIKTKKRKREDSESNKEIIKIDDTRNARTVFVGNLPTSFDKEITAFESITLLMLFCDASIPLIFEARSLGQGRVIPFPSSILSLLCNFHTKRMNLKSLFKQFGKVESARIRSAAPPKASVPKKVAVIKKLYHPDVTSFNGFVVFETEEMAQSALELNGVKIQDHHLRVDIAGRNQEHDHKRSIFVGNLPFDIQDDDLWDFFKECGEIKQVRTIKDKETRIGKGFGYILFKTIDAAALALEKNGEKLNGRPLRISRSMKKEKKIPKGKLSKEDRKKLYANKNFQGKKAKERLRVKKNKKIAKNRLRLKKKKMIAQKLQSSLKKGSDR